MLLWDVLARSSAVLLAAALANAALRGRSASLRHAIWVFGVVGALAVAPLSWVLPAWNVPLMRAWAPAEAPVATSAPAAPSDSASPPIALELVPLPRNAAAAPAPEAPIARAPAAPTPVTPAWTMPDIDWGLLLAACWALGTLMFLGRIAIANLVTLRALRAAAATDDIPWLDTARRLARVSGVPRTRFIRSERITMPMAAGYLRPTVALPVEADAWPDERLSSVLLHELAHVRRRDCLTQLAASTACALYWMNPLAWYAARALRRERERACDDAVLAAGTAGPEYAEHLLDVARGARHVTTPTWSGGVAMAHRSELEGRLMAILDDARNRQSMSYGAAGFAGILCLALVTPLAALDPFALDAAEAQTAVAAPARTATTPSPARPSARPVRAVAATDEVTHEEVAEAVSEAVASTHAIASATAAASASAIEARIATAVAVAPAFAHEFAFEIDDVHAEDDDQSLPTPAPTPTPTPTPTPSPAVAPMQPMQPGQGPAIAKGSRREVVPADPRVVAALAGALKDSDVEVRQQAAHSLGQMRDPAAVDALIPALQDTDVEVRQKVVFALGQLRDVRAIPGLTIALKDANEEVRERAAFALSQLRDPRAIEPLLIAAKDTNPDVRRQALFAIGQIDATRGKDAAIEALKDKDPEVRRMAAHLLGRLAHR
jgi:HEAT repeat protein/beta-lactamase regulating signal transducer with metallopeptidase domain